MASYSSWFENKIVDIDPKTLNVNVDKLIKQFQKGLRL